MPVTMMTACLGTNIQVVIVVFPDFLKSAQQRLFPDFRVLMF
jgi:hypothetical protein